MSFSSLVQSSLSVVIYNIVQPRLWVGSPQTPWLDKPWWATAVPSSEGLEGSSYLVSSGEAVSPLFIFVGAGKDHSWRGSGNRIWCRGSNPGLRRARQAPHPRTVSACSPFTLHVRNLRAGALFPDGSAWERGGEPGARKLRCHPRAGLRMGLKPPRAAVTQDGVQGWLATVDAAAAHAGGRGVAHTLPVLGLLQPAHAVRREGRGAPVSGPAQLPSTVGGGTTRPTNGAAVRKPDIPVPYLYFDIGAAVLCASFMSFGVKRRWFALGAALQLAISTYAAYVGGYVHYGDWLKVRMYSRTVAIIGGFLVLASGAGELYRQKPRSRSLQSTGQVFLGIYLICVAYSLQHSKEDRLAYLNHLPGGELTIQLFFVLYGVLALAFLSGYYVTLAAQILAILLPPVMLLIDGNVAYWHNTRRVEFWNQMKLLGENVGIFGAAVILATDG